MAPIKEQLSEELKNAMKSHDVDRRDVIRMIESEISLAKSAAGFIGEVNDDLYRRVIASYSKKMDKARAEYLELGPRGEEMARKLGWEV
ncbi:MAG: GatB/YqeY domain-containing protein, partial [Acidimicrobiia bacterium]